VTHGLDTSFLLRWQLVAFQKRFRLRRPGTFLLCRELVDMDLRGNGGPHVEALGVFQDYQGRTAARDNDPLPARRQFLIEPEYAATSRKFADIAGQEYASPCDSKSLFEPFCSNA
jgi:hypothetical protein